MSRRDDKMSNREKIGLGMAIGNPFAATALAGLVAAPARAQLESHPPITSEAALKKFIMREGLRGQVGEDVKLTPGSSRTDFQVQRKPHGKIDGPLSLKDPQAALAKHDKMEWEVRLGTEDPIATMHELGHTQADNPLSSLRHWNLRKNRESIQMMERELSGMKSNADGFRALAKHIAKAQPRSILDAALAPVDEAVAWKNALKMPAAAGRRLKMLKSMAPAYGSYLTHSGLMLGGLGLVGSGLYGALRHKENE